MSQPMEKTTMLKYLTVAALMALLPTTTQAIAVGRTFSFGKPTPIAVGCTESKDALYVKKLWAKRDFYTMREFADWVDVRPAGERSCITFNETSDNVWRVVKREQPMSGFAWYCLQSTIDLRTDS